jgi:ribosomal protein S18 acetylase RimI-like enzyme/catechol 2,3-dioxygenase-like lactoylglutathione lyase family enzyme
VTGRRQRAGVNGVSLRPATAADVPRLSELVAAAYAHYVERLGGPPRPMTDDYAEVVRTHRVTVAERGGEIVALVVLGVDEEGFFIDNVAVDPSQQGTGAGRALLEYAEDAAREAGFDSIYLFTHERMAENLALYARIGYMEYDRRPHGGASIVYLRKKLVGVARRELQHMHDDISRAVPNIRSDQPAQTRDFFVDLLGFEVAMDLGWVVTVASPTNPTAQVTIIGNDDPAAPGISVGVSDVDAVHARAVELGLEIAYPLRDEEWGVRRFMLREPSGTIVNVVSHRSRAPNT